MYKKQRPPIFLITLCIVCSIFALVCCTIAYVRLFKADRQLKSSQKTLAAQTEELNSIKKELKKADDKEKKQADRGKRETPSPTPTPSPAPSPSPTVSENTSTPSPAVSSQQVPENLSANENTDQQTPAPSTGGRIIAIDPGHQGPHVDMSATEPNGPNSAEMKAKATSGTSGVYSGLGEYQLNLDVSLKLQQILEDRGYQVVMCRSDNDTAISNAERALLAAQSGAEIYVRIHANGSDDRSVQGALSMSPSPSNPYVPHLYTDSQRLSQTLLDSYCGATGFDNRGVQYTDTMTGINWSQVPVTILEMGFMSNEHDDLAMADSNFQQTMAQGIADGIDTYFGQ